MISINSTYHHAPQKAAFRQVSGLVPARSWQRAAPPMEHCHFPGEKWPTKGTAKRCASTWKNETSKIPNTAVDVWKRPSSIDVYHIYLCFGSFFTIHTSQVAQCKAGSGFAPGEPGSSYSPIRASATSFDHDTKYLYPFLPGKDIHVYLITSQYNVALYNYIYMTNKYIYIYIYYLYWYIWYLYIYMW